MTAGKHPRCQFAPRPVFQPHAEVGRCARAVVMEGRATPNLPKKRVATTTYSASYHLPILTVCTGK
jgi:hypothetical protein